VTTFLTWFTISGLACLGLILRYDFEAIDQARLGSIVTISLLSGALGALTLRVVSWNLRRKGPVRIVDSRVAPTAPSPLGKRGLVFISYAREDELAARRIERGLLECGCSVYFDQERLSVGQNYHQQLAEQVTRDCAVFVSVVSEVTESAIGDHYFRRERNWAAKRLEAFAPVDQSKFYLPLLIHKQLPQELLREPQETRFFQRIACPDGVMPADTGAKIRSLQLELGGR
jgi:TIR domain